MQLTRRPPVYALPSYSLTGDLLGYLRCGLQYRFNRLGHLPPTRPVQLWFGQFIHGVLEEAYREYGEARQEGTDDPPPWPADRIESLCDRVMRRLAAQRLFPYDERLEKIGRRRAAAAINDLGPNLFPLIHRAEIRLRGSRHLPLLSIPTEYHGFREADRYEVTGVVDVITHVELGSRHFAENELVQVILAALDEDPPERFEIIIDYKGMRRPPKSTGGIPGLPSLWDIYAWQVQTYAHLRSKHADSLPVIAGAIIYVNELAPTRSDLEKLRQELRQGVTDVSPEPDDQLAEAIRSWNPDSGEAPPRLPLAFRLRRALRVIPVTEVTTEESLDRFDEVVAQIETSRARELDLGRIIATWDKNPSDQSTCTACDARTVCPANTRHVAPRVPRVKRESPPSDAGEVQAW